MQIVNFHAELMLFVLLNWFYCFVRSRNKKGEMLCKFTLDLHVLKASFLKVFVDESSYHIQYFYLDSRSRGTF